ncbi:hypothetical protein N0V82_003635 [Gnomoniopsis sp. IMI 355080]|nr:hypothetical protein N0V82_003635 [Gnomoniopsis sp. IMI 355080]
MANRKTPNAWDDDDWETQADRALQDGVEGHHVPEPTTKAERLAKHREMQRKIWEAAEEPSPQLPYHVAAAPSIPFAQGFKPQMKLLSRKPIIKTKDPVTGLEKLTVEDDDDEVDQKPQQPTAAELAEKRRQKEREYEERRATLFGTPPQETTSGASTPRTISPPLGGDSSRGNYRGRGRGRGGRGGRGGQRNENKNDSQGRQGSNSKNGESPYRELFDPDAAVRPGSRQQRGAGTSSPTSRGPEPAIRNPRGPDSSGGFGFANRGAKAG